MRGHFSSDDDDGDDDDDDLFTPILRLMICFKIAPFPRGGQCGRISYNSRGLAVDIAPN
jgi:hypothetical protein